MVMSIQIFFGCDNVASEWFPVIKRNVMPSSPSIQQYGTVYSNHTGMPYDYRHKIANLKSGDT